MVEYRKKLKQKGLNQFELAAESGKMVNRTRVGGSEAVDVVGDYGRPEDFICGFNRRTQIRQSFKRHVNPHRPFAELR